MGTGKTTVGERLATATGLELIDMDTLIEARAGQTISSIFAEDGEPVFRQMERELVQELSQREGLVISPGGGIVLDPENIAAFERSGLVVCLKAPVEEIFRRVEGEAHRPLLNGDKREQIEAILAKRAPLYNAVPHGIETGGLSPDEVTEKILALYKLEN